MTCFPASRARTSKCAAGWGSAGLKYGLVRAAPHHSILGDTLLELLPE
jgi:hypothetical protein